MAWGGEKGLGEEETAPAGCCSPAPCSGQPCPAPPSACTGNSAPAAPVPRSGCSQTQQEEPQAGLKHRAPRCCRQQEGPLSWWVTETGHAASSCSTHGHSRGTRHLFHRAPGVFPQGVSAPWGPPSARTAAHTGGPQPTTAPGSEDFALQECDPVPKTQPEHHGVRSSPGSRRKELHEEVACPAPGPADGAHRSLAGLTQAVW